MYVTSVSVDAHPAPRRRADRCRHPALLNARLAIVVFISLSFSAVTFGADGQGGDYSLAGTAIRLENPNEAPSAPVWIDGKPYLFLFDTGCTRSVLDDTFRARLGGPIGLMRATTNDDMVLLDRFEAPPATLGGTRLTDLKEVACADLSAMRDGSGLAIFGVLGMDVLSHQCFTINFDNGKLVFFGKAKNVAGAPVTLNFSRVGAPLAIVTVDGAGAQEFMIDTGAGGSGGIATDVFSRLLRQGTAWPLSSTLGASAAGIASHRRARLRAVSIAGFRHRGLIFAEAPTNLLGTGYLSRYIVTFDFPARTMYLKPAARFAEASRRGLSGAAFWRSQGVTMVRSVRGGTAAEKAGLQVGDVLEEVDGRPARSLRLSEIVSRFCVSGERRLTVARGKQHLPVVLVLEDPHDPWQDPPIAFAPPMRAAAKPTH